MLWSDTRPLYVSSLLVNLDQHLFFQFDKKGVFQIFGSFLCIYI